MSVRSSGYVFSEPDDFGSLSATTGRSSMPFASCLSQSAMLPTASRSMPSSMRAHVDESIDAPRAQLPGRDGPDTP